MFCSQIRDLLLWIHDMRVLISADETIRSVSGAEALLAKYNEYKAEIDAREDSVSQVDTLIILKSAIQNLCMS